MKWINSTDLNHWADTRDCQDMLPELIKRLLISNYTKINKMRFPSGDSIYLSGWDGILECEENILSIASGVSLWEFGASKNTKQKAEDDYKKRKLNTLSYDSHDCTFVFVTPRVWDQSETWRNEKKENTFWKDIVVITAIELEDWIFKNPSVGIWLAERIKKSHSTGVSTIETFWKKWANGNNITLRPNILLGGRDREIEYLLSQTEMPSISIIQSMSQDESLAFIVACIINESNPYNLSRSIIVDKEETLIQIIEAYSNLIIIAVVENKNHTYAINNGHTIFYVSDVSESNYSENAIMLTQLDREKFIESLLESGLDREYSNQISRETARNITILRRRLELDFTCPEWTKPKNIRDLIPAILVGQWSDSFKADQDTLSLLSNEPYESYIRKLQRWVNSSDSPIINIDGNWRIISPYESFSFALKHLTRTDFSLYKEAIIRALDDIDPDAIAKSQSFTLELWENKQKYSNCIKEGLAQSAILISILGESHNIDSTNTGNIWIDNMISDILHKSNYEWWLSFKVIIPNIAEASPKSFISFIQDDLLKDKSIIKSIFMEKKNKDRLFGSNADYIEILLALESLAWQKKYLYSVSMILAELSTIENNDNIVNKPFDSLIRIYKVWYPQTFANLQERKQVLSLVSEKFPQQGFKLYVSFLNNIGHDSTSPTHSMRWRAFGQYKKIEVNSSDVIEAVNSIVEQLIESSCLSVDEIISMIRVSSLKSLGEYNRHLILNYLEKNSSVYNNNLKISYKLRDMIYHHKSYPDAKWSLSENEISRYETLLKTIKPKDIEHKHLWMFREHFLKTSDINRFDTDYAKRREITTNKRIKALDEILRYGGIDEVCIFINKAHAPDTIGEPLANLCTEEDIRNILLVAKDDKIPVSFLRSFLNYYVDIIGAKSFIGIIDSFKKEHIDFIHLPLSLLGANIEVWGYIENLSQEVQKKYWEKIIIVGWQDKSEDDIKRLIKKLNQVDRYNDSLDIIHILINKNISISQLAIDTLMLIIRNPIVNITYNVSYQITEIIEYLDKQEGLNDEHIIQIEFYFYTLLNNNSLVSDLKIIKALLSDPRFMIEIIKLTFAYTKEGADNTDINTKNPYNSEISFLGFSILDNLKGTPYVNVDNTIDEDSLNIYIRNLRSLAIQFNLLKHVDRIIGELLANYPETESYPSTIICKIIEKINSKELNRGFSIRMFNKMGITVRPALSGGFIERLESEKYKSYANTIRFSYPIVAEIFDDLSEQYEAMARRDDRITKIESMRY